MKHLLASHWARRPWLAALVLGALLLRSLIPSGYMPGPDGLMLCSGYGPVALAADEQMAHGDMADMDMSGMDMGHGSGTPSGDGSPCPFGAFGATVPAVFHCAAIAGYAPLVRLAIKPYAQSFVPALRVAQTVLPRGPPRFS